MEIVQGRTANAAEEDLHRGPDLSRIEGQLGAVLPESYKHFLREVGWSYWPEDIYGVSPGVPGMGLIERTRAEREDVALPLPRPLIPFSPDGWGNHYCMDTARLVDGECPVVLWDHQGGSDQELRQTHASFLDWLEATVQREMAYEAEDASKPTN
jgi:hypothetical protein